MPESHSGLCFNWVLIVFTPLFVVLCCNEADRWPVMSCSCWLWLRAEKKSRNQKGLTKVSSAVLRCPPSCHHPTREAHRCHPGTCPPCKQPCLLPLPSCSHTCPQPCHDVVLVKSQQVKDHLRSSCFSGICADPRLCDKRGKWCAACWPPTKPPNTEVQAAAVASDAFTLKALRLFYFPDSLC